jgi:flagellar basal body-associated protein FliL
VGEFARNPARVEECSKGGADMGILWIVLIVILVLVLLGYLGRGRLS